MRTLLIIILLAILTLGGWYISKSRSTPPEENTQMQEQNPTTTMKLTSSAFEHNGTIPSLYTCDGDKTKNPPLSITGVPPEALSLVLIMDDPDVPKKLRPDGVFDHWIVFNITPDTTEISASTTFGTLGVNSAGDNSYTGPCPPPQYEPSEHRYIFSLYALDTSLNLKEGATKQEVLQAMIGHIVAETQLVSRYKRE